jgi:hypothetical protein
MAYSFTTLNAGDAISRDTVVANLDGVKVYTHKVETSAIKGSQFVDPNLIMMPEYDPIRNVSTHVSGVYAGQNNGGINLHLQFSTRFNSGVGSMQFRQVVPKTSLQIKFVRPCSYLFQWWMNSFSKFDNASPAGETFLYVYTGRPNQIVQTVSALSVNESTSTSLPQSLGGFNSSGFHADIAQSAGTLNIGVCTDSKANAYHQAWGFSLEAFFI